MYIAPAESKLFLCLFNPCLLPFRRGSPGAFICNLPLPPVFLELTQQLMTKLTGMCLHQRGVVFANSRGGRHRL